jgi:hypothetical protein
VRVIANGTELRRDTMHSVVMRNDMVPVPITIEAEIMVDEAISVDLKEGNTIIAGTEGHEFSIIKSISVADNKSSYGENQRAIKIIAVLSSFKTVSFVRSTAIVKENTTLSDVYRAAGAQITVTNDTAIGRFTCCIGESPSFYIARACQENGGVIRWKNNKLDYFRLMDLYKQVPVLSVPDVGTVDTKSGFSERHLVPSFYSVSPSGEIITGNKDKARSARFVPHMNAQQLANLTTCLIHRYTINVDYTESICAGDIVNIDNRGWFIVVTAASVFRSGTDSSGSQQYTRLWLSSVEV